MLLESEYCQARSHQISELTCPCLFFLKKKKSSICNAGLDCSLRAMMPRLLYKYVTQKLTTGLFFKKKKNSTIYYMGLNCSPQVPMPGYCTRHICEKNHKSPCMWVIYPQFSPYPDAPSPVADKQVAKVQECHCPESQCLALFLPLACISSLSC
jgi:hypothetical protein